MASRRILPQLLRTPRQPMLQPDNLLHQPIPAFIQQLMRPRQVQFLPSTARLTHTIPRPKPREATPSNNSTTSTSEPPSEPTPSSTSASPATSTETPSKPLRPSQQPHYELTFTCVPCSTRSRHKITKSGYHHGSVLITCPGCRNRHVISDHLGIFGERAHGVTVEDLARERGILVKKGTLGEDGDLEFWEDGSVTSRNEGMEGVVEGRGEGAKGEETVDSDAVPGASFKKE